MTKSFALSLYIFANLRISPAPNRSFSTWKTCLLPVRQACQQRGKNNSVSASRIASAKSARGPLAINGSSDTTKGRAGESQVRSAQLKSVNQAAPLAISLRMLVIVQFLMKASGRGSGVIKQQEIELISPAFEAFS